MDRYPVVVSESIYKDILDHYPQCYDCRVFVMEGEERQLVLEGDVVRSPEDDDTSESFCSECYKKRV